MWICIVPCHERTFKALRYGTRSQRSHSFTCTPRLHPLTEWTYLPLPSSWSWYSFTHPGGMEGWVGIGWLVGYVPK